MTERERLDPPPAAPLTAEQVAAILVPEMLGVEVRRIWIEWAKEQPDPKPSWLVPWEELSEPDKEVDRRIGTGIAQKIVVDGMAALRDRLARAEAREHEVAERSMGLEHALMWALPMLKLWYPGDVPPYVANALLAPTDGAARAGDAAEGEPK